MRELGNDGHLLLSVSFLYATWSGMTVLIERERGLKSGPTRVVPSHQVPYNGLSRSLYTISSSNIQG